MKMVCCDGVILAGGMRVVVSVVLYVVKGRV